MVPGEMTWSCGVTVTYITTTTTTLADMHGGEPLVIYEPRFYARDHAVRAAATRLRRMEIRRDHLRSVRLHSHVHDVAEPLEEAPPARPARAAERGRHHRPYWRR